MEIGDKKAGYINTDFYNEDGPLTSLDPLRRVVQKEN